MGYFVGAVPGLNRPTALAIAIPFTYSMSPLAAISLLLGIAKGSAGGGAVAAILINVPGEPGSAATTLDGYPMAKNGQAGKALQIALYSSVFGDVLATIALIAISAPLAQLALKVGPIELCALIIFSLTFVIALSGDSLIKGVIAALIGMFLATWGLDPGTGLPRMTFGIIDLEDGIPLISLGVGIMACSEMMIQLRTAMQHRAGGSRHVAPAIVATDSRLTWKEAKALLPTMFRSGFVSIFVGIAPGLGALMASFISYSLAKQRSKHPEMFGKGAPEGVAASETADNGATTAAYIPLFALGIPGSVAAAITIGAFTMHGLAPGPLLFQQEAPLVYAIYIGLILASLSHLLIGQYGMKFFIFLAQQPMTIIIPVALTTSVVGVYAEDSSLFAVVVLLIFAFAGYVMNRTGLSFVPFIIGFILGPMLELYFRQATILTHENPINLIYHPIALVFLALAAFGTWRFAHGRKLGRSRAMAANRAGEG